MITVVTMLLPVRLQRGPPLQLQGPGLLPLILVALLLVALQLALLLILQLVEKVWPLLLTE